MFGKNLYSGHYFTHGTWTLNLRCEMKNTEIPELKSKKTRLCPHSPSLTNKTSLSCFHFALMLFGWLAWSEQLEHWYIADVSIAIITANYLLNLTQLFCYLSSSNTPQYCWGTEKHTGRSLNWKSWIRDAELLMSFKGLIPINTQVSLHKNGSRHQVHGQLLGKDKEGEWSDLPVLCRASPKP